MDPQDHMSNEVTAEEYPAVVAQYQQMVADRDYTIATLRVKLAKANARLQLEREDKEKAQSEAETLRGALNIHTEDSDTEVPDITSM